MSARLHSHRLHPSRNWTSEASSLIQPNPSLLARARVHIPDSDSTPALGLPAAFISKYRNLACREIWQSDTAVHSLDLGHFPGQHGRPYHQSFHAMVRRHLSRHGRDYRSTDGACYEAHSLCLVLLRRSAPYGRARSGSTERGVRRGARPASLSRLLVCTVHQYRLKITSQAEFTFASHQLLLSFANDWPHFHVHVVCFLYGQVSFQRKGRRKGDFSDAAWAISQSWETLCNCDLSSCNLCSLRPPIWAWAHTRRWYER